MSVGNEMRTDAMQVRGILKVVALMWIATGFSAGLVAQEEETIFLSTENTTEWDWFEGRTAPPNNWRSLFFNPNLDPDWKKGVTPFGYGESIFTVDRGTIVDQGAFLSIFLRLPFVVEFPERVVSIEFTLFHDDGVIAYLNEEELGRASLPQGGISFNTPGFDHESTEEPFQVTLTRENGDLDGLVTGLNVLAFSLHNSAIGSSDLAFRHVSQDFKLTFLPPPPPEFVRGTQCDGIESLDIGAPVYALRFAMGQVLPPGCIKACDMDDNGAIEMTDGVFALMFLFAGGTPFPAPYPEVGVDTVDDELTCLSGLPEF